MTLLLTAALAAAVSVAKQFSFWPRPSTTSGPASMPESAGRDAPALLPERFQIFRQQPAELSLAPPVLGQRDIRVETDKDIRSREYIIVLTCRVALGIEEETAVVKYTNI